MRKPKSSNKVTATRVESKLDTESSTKTTANIIDIATLNDQDLALKHSAKKLFVHIKNPDDHDSLLMLKQVCSQFIGTTDIVLVLGAGKKSAIKLPFKIDPSDELVGSLVKILGEDAVVLK